MENSNLKWNKRNIVFAAILSIMMAAPSNIAALAGEINTGYFGNVAIEGYDPVAYFTMKKAVKGTKQFTHKWLGATWQFASAKHRNLFVNKPISYAPQYGGFCADGMAYGTTTANLNPQAFRIIEGKLYLNHDMGAAEELESVAGQIDKADKAWQKLRSELTN